MKVKSVLWCKEKVNIPGISFNRYESETALQIYCADWLRKQAELYPDNDGFRWWHHSANERGNGREGFIAKMMGQAKGFPDFIHCGLKLAIELKIDRGRLSDSQNSWKKHFLSIGWTTETIYNFERFKELVLSLVSRQS